VAATRTRLTMRGWRIRRLRNRIILSFALLLVAGQGIGYWLVDAASSRNARGQLQQELVAGERVFARLLEHNRNQLAQAARVLAADYGFREAIATRDAATMKSVLHNHGERIEASTMQLLSPDGMVQAQVGRSATCSKRPGATARPARSSARGCMPTSWSWCRYARRC